ncbi:MAG TPA: GerMN domain-containing protein [Actinobacteria bacterium]|nr:GerMN domain-containing protein [Actinomycetota bacterium]
MNERKFVKTSFWFVKSIKLFLVIFLLCIFCALMVFNSSCSSSSASETSKIDVESSNENQKSQTDKGQSKEESGATESTKETAEEESATSSSEMVTTTTKEGLTIRVYYADAETIYLVGEERLVKGSHKYFEAFIELMKPPITPGLIKLIPDTAKVNKITKDDSNIDIDLSQSFINDRFKSDSVDMLLIYSIVNTMTEFPEINTVTFHFDGKKADTFGQMDLSESFYRDTSLIKKNN